MIKKILFIIIFCLCNYLFADNGDFTGRSRFGLQLLGNHQASVGGLVGNEDVQVGFSFSGEFLYALHDFFEFGIGIEYQIVRRQVRFAGNFNFAPIYAVVRIPFDLGLFTPFLIGRVGYNFFFGDIEYTGTYGVLSGGLYYAVGGGIDFINFTLFDKPCSIFIEATYSSNSGSLDDNFFNFSANLIYTKIDVFLGFRRTF